MKTWEIEISNSIGEEPDYLYIQTEDDIEIEAAPGNVTHICNVDNMDDLTDLVIRRNRNGN